MKKNIYSLLLAFSAMSVYAQNEAITTEYFFDKDPGYGKGIKAGTTENGIQSFNADVRDLHQGFHTLYVRGNNIYGWGQTSSFQFVVFDKVDEILGTEYFFDNDPGVGKGHFNPIANQDSSNKVTTNISKLNVSLEGLEPGYHTVSVRALNGDKTWSNTITSPYVYIKAIELPKKAEYFFDHDPGEGNGSRIECDGKNMGFALETSKLDNGNHVLYVRTQDGAGNWNMENISPFTFSKQEDKAKAEWSMPITISPNPAQYSFTIQFGKEIPANDSVNVSIYSQSGKEVFKEKFAVVNNAITMSTSQFNSGSYLVTISKEWLSSSKRLIIKKRQAENEGE